ncbi:MAG TPA: alpha/beta hydrolase [Actinophytocola sp.]|uniref:alpha/beta hydrolase n=1 Tax=Actinophytocola sp. TaxID=1872138 RepID=UPI002DDD1C9D|nr:alpha/beta hydrolase [Actinophytocola sp.]HEV2783656.1 alpha/beta hydrolase [Actinophytocola sp.]
MTLAHTTVASAAPARLPVPATPSVQSRALAQLLMNSLRRVGDVARLQNVLYRRLVREVFDLVGYTPLARGTRVHAITGDGVRGLWIAARNADETAGAILYLHGGGFVFGGPRTHRHLVAALSAACGRPALLLNYRRAPEHPFPAAADDALSGFRWLLDQGFPAGRIAVIGDSAGGHLAAGLLADLHRKRRPMPAAAVLFSPFLDLTGAELDARDAARRDPFVPPARARECGLAYAGKLDFGHRRLDVLRGDKRRWPPILVQVGDTECLLGDSERLAEAVNAAGGHCELQVWPGQVHVFQAFYPLIPEGRRAIRDVAAFLRQVTAEPVAATA